MIDVSFFFWVGSFDLLILLIQDLRTLTVEVKWSWIMSGCNIALIFLGHPPLLYLIAVLAFSIVFPMLTKQNGKMGFFAKGDVQIMQWQLLGLGIICSTFIYLYLIFLLLSLGIHTIFRVILKIDGKVAGLPILCATFWAVSAIYYIVFANM
jgi:hypothetical protein